MIKNWEDYKVRPLSKKDFKTINKAAKKVLDDKIPFRLRDQLKWSIIALLDELVEIEDVLDQIEINKNFDNIFKKESKAIVLVPAPKTDISSICTNIEKDNRFKLLP